MRAPSSNVVRRARWSGGRRGISLMEMMIAVVILGLGLLMIATIFPVSWARARRLAEFRAQRSAESTAAATVKSLLRVAGTDAEVLMLQGDQALINGRFFTADDRVLSLNLGNISFTAPRRFVGDDSWRLELTDTANEVDPNRSSDWQEYFKDNGIRTFLDPLVALHGRVFPPMGFRESPDFSEFSQSDQRWDQALATRRFLWSVFYKLHPDYVRRVNRAAGDLLDETRVLTMYYVTLRRTRPTLRFARQDPTAVPDPGAPEDVVPIQALTSDQDVLFPAPWRVQVLVPDGSRTESNNQPGDISVAGRGVPTQVFVNLKKGNGREGVASRIDDTGAVVGMFARGSMFIDERTGLVFRVEKRELRGNDQDEAVLTLDREILMDDLVDADVQNLSAADRLRTVWLFPPAVQGGRTATEDPLVFDGPQPVVGITVRSLTMAP